MKRTTPSLFSELNTNSLSNSTEISNRQTITATTTKIEQLKKELETTQREQVTDIYANFPTRLGRYVKIKLIRFTLNTLTK